MTTAPERPNVRGHGRYWHAFHPHQPDQQGVLRLHPRTSRYAAVLNVAAVLLLFAVAIPTTRSAIQAVDDRVLSFMIRVRVTPITWIGLAFNVVGGVWVTLPLRVLLGVYLAIRRRWWFLATHILAVASSEVFSTLFKHVYARPRPPGPLVHTTGASFPSGHAVAASVTALTLVIVLVEPRRRRAWWTWAIVFTLLMAASRAYLRAHWLSDGVEGVLLGSACAVDAAIVVQAIRNRWTRAGEEAPIEPPGGKPGPLQADAVDKDSNRPGRDTRSL